jgi:hypothetical protein
MDCFMNAVGQYGPNGSHPLNLVLDGGAICHEETLP